MTQTALDIPVAAPFDFAGTAYSHGWVVLAPNTWDAEHHVVQRIERLNTDEVVSLRISGIGRLRGGTVRVEVESTARLGKRARNDVTRRVRHMFRLDEDLSVFYQECRRRGAPWKRITKGLGRLLRSPSLFEDIVKVICTTNVQWSGTKRMVADLVATYGEPLVGHRQRRSFPSPNAIASVTTGRFANSVRLGYRASYVHELAQQVASGTLELAAFRDPELPTAQLKKRLLAIKGIGNYAAATLLMLLGRYDELPIDTVCRDFVTKKYFPGHEPTERQIRRVYEDWGEWKFLAYWYDIWSGYDEPL